MNFQRWCPLVSVFVPQSRISFDRAKVSGSMPPGVPLIRDSPVFPAAEQMFRKCLDAPSTFQNRRPATPSDPWT